MPTEAENSAARPSVTRLLVILGLIVLVLTLVFGLAILRSRRAFRAYVEGTLEDGRHPPEGQSVDHCVTYAVQWGMACPGIQLWCQNETPRVARACFEAGEVAAYCHAQGEAVAQTSFGVAECVEARRAVEGKYAQRNHKKLCASVYRALAELCRGS